MGTLNLLKGKYDGRVGQTVGAKWKDKATLRSYAKPSNPQTTAQTTVRTVFATMTSAVALFADQIKYLTSLDTRGQSVRNAIIQANKAQITAGTFTPSTFIVNKGGLPNATVSSATYASNKVTVAFTAPAATNISAKAKFVAVAVDRTNKVAATGSCLLTASPLEISATFATGASVDVYYWIIDYRGSSRVGSFSGYQSITVA